MGNSCGRIHRTKQTNAVKIQQTDIERRQLSRAEKYQFFLAIRDQPEDDVIYFMKENPWTLSTTFWFETDRCSCSKDFELGIKESITTTEMMARLELCISTAMCPHVLLKKSGVAVNIHQDVSFEEMSTHQIGLQHLKCERYSNKLTAGVYWIHLAIFFGKEKLVEEILSLSSHLKDISFVSLCNKTSPVLIAILHKRKATVKCLGRIHPYLIWHRSHNLNNENEILSSDGNMLDSALIWTLASDQFEDFLFLWILAQMYAKSLKKTFCFEQSIWADKLYNAIITDNRRHIDCLTKVKGVSERYYSSLFRRIYEADCSTGYKIILEQTDFCHRFFRRKKHSKFLDSGFYLKITAREAFYGNEETVKLLIDQGFDVNAKLSGVSLLTWTEALNEQNVSKLLVAAGARKQHPLPFCLIDIAKTLSSYPISKMDVLYLIHKLYENGFRLISFDRTCKIMSYYVFYDDYILKYMLLRGEYTTHVFTINNDLWNFLYLITTTNSCVTFSKVLLEHSFYDLGEPFELLSILPEIANKSSIEEIVSPESMEWLATHIIPQTPKDTHIQWYSCVRSLQSLCRSALSTHFKCARYLQYLKLIKAPFPTLLYNYLQKDDIIQVIWKHMYKLIDKNDNAFKNVESYFL